MAAKDLSGFCLCTLITAWWNLGWTVRLAIVIPEWSIIFFRSAPSLGALHQNQMHMHRSLKQAGAVAFAASVELTSSPLLLVNSGGNSGDSRNTNIKGKEFKERVFEMRSLNTVAFHACSLILYRWELILKAKVAEGEWVGKSRMGNSWGTGSPLSTLYGETKGNSLFLICIWCCVLQPRSLPSLCQGNCCGV